MTEYKEEEAKEVGELELITASIAQLSVALQTQNEILLTILHNLELKAPEWGSKEDIEKEVGPKIKMCVEAVRKVYGPDKTDKS